MSAAGPSSIVVVVVLVTLVVVVAGVVIGVLVGRRSRRGPAVPDPYTRTETVAGLPATVRTPPFVERRWLGMQNGGWSRPGGVVDVRVHGTVDRPPFTVLPRHRPEQNLAEPFIPPAVAGFVNSSLMAAATHGATELPTGDTAFDHRYRVTVAPGTDPQPVLTTLSDAVRALLLEQDFLQVLVRHDGVWAVAFYSEAVAVVAAEQAAKQVLARLVTG